MIHSHWTAIVVLAVVTVLFDSLRETEVSAPKLDVACLKTSVGTPLLKIASIDVSLQL